MQNELHRLASFSALPKLSKINPLLSARVGFFYSGNGKVECFACEIQFSILEAEERLEERHRTVSPLCKFVLKSDDGNLPLKSLAFFLKEVRSLPEVTQNKEGNLANTLKAAWKRTFANNVFERGFGINLSQPDYDLLCFEEVRLSTYHDWPPGAHANPQALAREGLFYTGSDDRVQCAFCRGYLSSWEPTDVPAVEHRRHFPNCSFVLRATVEEPPNISRIDAVAVDQIRDNRNGNENHLSGELSRARSQPNEIRFNQTVCAEPPKHPQYSDVAIRIQSFVGGQISPGHTAEHLADSGWFYVGPGDKVRCFQCGGNLRDWEPEDDPWEEHKRWYNHCPYIKTHRPCVRSRAIEVPHPMLPASANYRIEPREIKARMDTPTVKAIIEMGYPKELIRTAIETQLMTTGDDFPNAESLLEAIFELQRSNSSTLSASSLNPVNPSVGTTIPSSSSGNQNSNAETVGEQSVSSDLATGISNMSLVSESSESLAAGVTISLEPVGNRAPESQSKPKGKRKRNKKKKSSAPPESNAADVDIEVGPSEDQNAEAAAANVVGTLNIDENVDDETQLYLEENRQLREARLCKVCMDSDIDTVFLPCGHFVCCNQCSPKLQSCPICRNFIRGTVKTFLS